MQGNISEVLEWVGGDPDRAAEAYIAEAGSDKPRKTLLAELELIDSGGHVAADPVAVDPDPEVSSTPAAIATGYTRRIFLGKPYMEVSPDNG